jgi:hypothetical protein
MQMEEGTLKPEKDLTRSILTETDIRNIVNRIFPDGLIVTQSLTIASVGKNLRLRLGYTEENLSGHPLSTLTGNALQEQKITDLLKPGFFEGQTVDLIHRLGQKYACQVSGFYLGIISDINDLIVLQFHFYTSLLP